ncbi:hypothetical protein ECANGB1_1419 [Enterospora canceri]|uniref:Uncharacterized protein n=1 Tax=Enterospora canceri TaxID=1081671 RepID=A0A1Y1S3Y9_9MICR|nr:hypothetical protein ECANGB1_1419 [Enterospora canceri]
MKTPKKTDKPVEDTEVSDNNTKIDKSTNKTQLMAVIINKTKNEQINLHYSVRQPLWPLICFPISVLMSLG